MYLVLVWHCPFWHLIEYYKDKYPDLTFCGGGCIMDTLIIRVILNVIYVCDGRHFKIKLSIVLNNRN